MKGQANLEITGAIPIEGSPDPGAKVEALFDTHADRLYRLARRLTSSADEARDLVQETFLKIAEQSGKSRGSIANEEAWLVRVLINIRRDQWRKTATRKRLDEARIDTMPFRRTDADPESALIARNTVWRALDKLPQRRRAVIAMHELDGMQISAIASILGISAITARWHLSKGLKELSKLLKSQLEK
jgi:RNA polymerase sigma-70 factor (ECF subfamily)